MCEQNVTGGEEVNQFGIYGDFWKKVKILCARLLKT